jgi:[ribosomal protein S5]-alanine N-acetyltransferase
LKKPGQNKTILETPRLILRTWSADDLHPAYEIFRDPGVMQNIGDGKPFDLQRTAEFLSWVENYENDNGFCRWKVVNKSDGEILGSCGFALLEDSHEVDLGYLLRRDAWGHGFATEAVRACMRYGFRNLGFREIIAMTGLENMASRRVLEKAGFSVRGREILKGEEALVYVAADPKKSL